MIKNLFTYILISFCFVCKTQAQTEQSLKEIKPTSIDNLEFSKIDSTKMGSQMLKLNPQSIQILKNLNNSKNDLPNLFYPIGKMPIYVPDGCFGGMLVAKVSENYYSPMPITKVSENYYSAMPIKNF